MTQSTPMPAWYTLKSCPFCGSIHPRRDKIGPLTLCEYCGASAPHAVWNRRALLAGPSPSGEVREALEKARDRLPGITM